MPEPEVFEKTYAFPDDAGVADTSTDPVTDGGEPFNIVVTEPAGMGVCSGGIDLRADWDSPYILTSGERTSIHGSWTVSAEVIQVTALGVTNDDNSNETVYVPQGQEGELLYSPDESGTSTAPVYTANLDIDASISSETFSPAAWSYVKYRVLGEGGAVVDSGAVPLSGTLCSFDVGFESHPFNTLQVWFDGNSSGTVDNGEIATLAKTASRKINLLPAANQNHKVLYERDNPTNERQISIDVTGTGWIRVTYLNSMGVEVVTTTDFVNGTSFTFESRIKKVEIHCTTSEIKGMWSVDN